MGRDEDPALKAIGPLSSAFPGSLHDLRLILSTLLAEGHQTQVGAL